MLDQTLFRNYDIRGEYGTALTEDAVNRIARAYVSFASPISVIVGMDARTSSPALKDSLIQGLRDAGVRVVDIGLVSTDATYFSAWKYEHDGAIMVTASHMPKEFNGLKFLRVNESGMLMPIGRGVGMEELQELANGVQFSDASEKGPLTEQDIWADFVAFCHSFVDISKIGSMRVVMDAGNGMGGYVADKVFAGLPLEITRMYFEPDGTFPNHAPNPFIEENRREIMARVVEEKADIGIAWDADCDRVYFIDEKGAFVPGDFITALLGLHFLKGHPGASFVYDVRASWAVKDVIEAAGGHTYAERVGHTYIKKRMQEVDAVFGGEVSGHYYFAANKYMESGFAPALIILEMMSVQKKTLSEIIASLGSYFVSGEMNFSVDDAQQTLERVEAAFAQETIDKTDGVSVIAENWHCNVRPSANDPVVRLNVEARSQDMLDAKVAQVSSVIGGTLA
jgi:phosphomannomutase